MIVEVVFDEQYTPPTQRRPNGQVKKGSTKKGNKKRGLRARLVGLLDKEDGPEDEEDEDSWSSSGGRPPAMTSLIRPNWLHVWESIRNSHGGSS
jgi:hypothetical protein